MHNIKRNKKIIDSIKAQQKRLGQEPSISNFLKYNVADFIPVSIAFNIHSKTEEQIVPEIFDNDAVLIESLKVLGIMETCKTGKELTARLAKKGQIKYSENMKKMKEPTDFDRVLKGIMKVPNKR